eukprot:scaffold294900_cov10-Tisochrysis_lutea.AAC.1
MAAKMANAKPDHLGNRFTALALASRAQATAIGLKLCNSGNPNSPGQTIYAAVKQITTESDQ